jgi:cyclopropane fatty-acyl-phospholipid synthase-like methyltransferase
MDRASVNLWANDEHAAHYLDRADTIPHRAEGEAALLEWIPPHPSRLLDLGSGDGRLLSRLVDACAPVEAVALDFSPMMLGRLRARFAAGGNISITVHDLEEALPQELGIFDVIVSSFAIHHLTHTRKRTLYQEVYSRLRPAGVFCNLEHVASPTVALHNDFLARLDTRPQDEDPSNKLLDVTEQLRWLRDVGFTDVDCHWKWRELALLAGRRGVVS